MSKDNPVAKHAPTFNKATTHRDRTKHHRPSDYFPQDDDEVEVKVGDKKLKFSKVAKPLFEGNHEPFCHNFEETDDETT